MSNEIFKRVVDTADHAAQAEGSNVMLGVREFLACMVIEALILEQLGYVSTNSSLSFGVTSFIKISD